MSSSPSSPEEQPQEPGYAFQVEPDGSLSNAGPSAPHSAAEPEPADGEGAERQVRVQVLFPARPRPWVTYSLIAFTVLIWLAQILTKTLWQVDWPGFWGLKLNEFIRAGQVWRLVTPMFLHDDNLPFHILTNMYFLFVVGSEMEQIYGHWRFLTLYALGGLMGNALSFALSPAGAWGASTALFGLLAANGVFIWQNKAWLQNSNRAMQNVAFTIIVNIALGLGIGADNWGHLGGALGGAVFAWLAGPRWKMEPFSPGVVLVADERGGREWFNAAAVTFFLFLLLTLAGFVWGVPGLEQQWMN